MLITSHMVWGYVFGKVAARDRKNELNPALLILAGALPDFDLFTRQPSSTLFGHHGISHSWLVICVLFIPFLYKFRMGALPYFVAVIQHPVFGDLIANSIPILFPLSLSGYGVELFEWNPFAAVWLEVLGFVIFVVYFFLSGDWQRRLRPTIWNKLWLALWVPVLGITIAEAVWYYEPITVTFIYAAYAVASSLFLLWLGLHAATRSFLGLKAS